MNPWKLKYHTIRVKLITEWQLLKYRVKTFLGFKKLGFEEPFNLVAFKLLKSMNSLSLLCQLQTTQKV